MGYPLSGFSSLFEICFAINIGYSTIVTLRRERLAFFDTVDMISRRGLAHGEVQFAAHAISPLLRSTTASINAVSLWLMIFAAIAALAFLFYGSTNSTASLTHKEALSVFGILLAPALLSIALTAVATRNCKRILAGLICEHHSQQFLIKLETFVRSDSYSLEKINKELVASWSTTEDFWKSNGPEQDIRWWHIFFPWSRK